MRRRDFLKDMAAGSLLLG
ncbi:MAG: twin-arginine translocation signal domain-containing protein, partial [Candidatus Aminicenantes bacterium]|nr:twin-arginine translocation signal domain-containing protein [Candidatus Aminicenantes bacterium]